MSKLHTAAATCEVASRWRGCFVAVNRLAGALALWSGAAVLLGGAALLGSAALLTGCVSMKPDARPRATALFSVVLRGEVPEARQPTGLLVGIDGQDGADGRQFAFAPNTRIPGHYTAFLVRLELPPGPHRLTHLSGVVGAGTLAPEFDVVTRMPFEVKAGSREYLGHLELSYPDPATPGGPRLVMADAYEEDLPNFVHAWPALRGHIGHHRGTAAIVEIPAQPGQLMPRTPEQNPTAAARLDASASAGLPPAARRAFRTFLNSSYPRAFAVSAGGQTGTAVGGKDVIVRALQRCRRADTLADSAPPENAGSGNAGSETARPNTPRAHPCRLFAVDDTLTSSLQRPNTSAALKQ